MVSSSQKFHAQDAQNELQKRALLLSCLSGPIYLDSEAQEVVFVVSWMLGSAMHLEVARVLWVCSSFEVVFPQKVYRVMV